MGKKITPIHIIHWTYRYNFTLNRWMWISSMPSIQQHVYLFAYIPPALIFFLLNCTRSRCRHMLKNSKQITRFVACIMVTNFSNFSKEYSILKVPYWLPPFSPLLFFAPSFQWTLEYLEDLPCCPNGEEIRLYQSGKAQRALHKCILSFCNIWKARSLIGSSIKLSFLVSIN